MRPKISILRPEVKHLSSQGLQLRKVRNMLNDQMGFFYAYDSHENNNLCYDILFDNTMARFIHTVNRDYAIIFKYAHTVKST